MAGKNDFWSIFNYVILKKNCQKKLTLLNWETYEIYISLSFLYTFETLEAYSLLLILNFLHDLSALGQMDPPSDLICSQVDIVSDGWLKLANCSWLDVLLTELAI